MRKFNIKLMLFLIVFLGVLFICNTSKAFTVNVDNTEYILPDLPTGAGDLPSDVVPPDHFYITKKSNENIFRLHYPRYRGAYLSDWVYWGITDNHGLAFFDSNFNPVKYLAVEEYSYTVGANSWSHVGTVETNVSYGAVTNNFVYMSHDYYDAATQEILFPTVPPEEPIVEEPEEETTILAPIVETQEMKPLEEILGILPLILALVVSFLGLRKALRMLSMLLRRA